MYTQKDFSHLLGLDGFSDLMLNNHFTLYGGYVTNANKLIPQLDVVEKGSIEYYELKRRLAWEVNGIKLHELYFENMTKDTSGDISTELDKNEAIKNAIVENYKSVEEWEASLKRNASMRGIGWVMLVRDRDTGKLFHTWVGEHNVGLIPNADILLVMDMWEHAFMTDYGIKKPDYIATFTKAIDWGVVNKRLTV